MSGLHYCYYYYYNIIIIILLKTEFLLKNIEKFTSYLLGHTLHLLSSDQPVNAFRCENNMKGATAL
jgi:hypothetical protein